MSSTSSAAFGTGLTFTGMNDLGISKGFELKFHNGDPSAQLYLYIGHEANRVLISGTTPLSRQGAVLAAIDQFSNWGIPINVWMGSERNGTRAALTRPVSYVTHVKPFCGQLNITGIANDDPKMTYSGNGFGRLLSRQINGRYYFVHGGKLETAPRMRGFDCTTFPMALFGIHRGLPGKGYGKDLCDLLKASRCGLEEIRSIHLKQMFIEDTIPNGVYVLFSQGHVLLYNSDLNILYEFTYGGFQRNLAPRRPHLHAAHICGGCASFPIRIAPSSIDPMPKLHVGDWVKEGPSLSHERVT